MSKNRKMIPNIPKSITYVRKGKVIKGIESEFKKVYASINEAKRASRKLQASGEGVRNESI